MRLMVHFEKERGQAASLSSKSCCMNQVLKREQFGIKALIVLILFFDFFSKFIAYQYFSNVLPFQDFLIGVVGASIGDVILLGVLFVIFNSEIKTYAVVPDFRDSLFYGFGLKVLMLAIMVPIGYLSLLLNRDFFYVWWEYRDIEIFGHFEALLYFDYETIVFFFCVAVVTPIVEEVIYRVVALKILRRRYSYIRSVIFVGALFGIFHPTYFFFFFFFSIVMSFLLFKTGSVWSAIIAHSVFNILSLIDAYYTGIGSFKPLESVGSPGVWSVQALFIPLAAGLVYLFIRNNRRTIRAFISDSPPA